MNENDTQQPKTNRITKIVGIGLILLVLSGGIAYFWNYEEENGDEVMRDKTLGEKLDDNGWMLFTADSCPWCDNQIHVLGHNRFDIKIDSCNTHKECMEMVEKEGLYAFPTWHNVFSNETFVGFQNLTQLEEMAK